MGFLMSLLITGCLAPPVEVPIVDPFRPPTCVWCPGNRGIEFGPTLGHDVLAASAGTVSFSGRVAGVLYVVLQHPDGTRTTYGGLLATERWRGEHVALGETVGTGGFTLHFGLRRGDDYLDPTPMLGRLARRARLVPVDGTPARPAGDQVRCVADGG